MKKKLVYIVHELKIGGVEVALLSALPSLIAEFDLKVFVLGKIDEEWSKSLKKEQRSALVSFPFFNYLLPLYALMIVVSILRLRPAIVVSSLWKASFIGVLIKKLSPQTKFVSFIHSTFFFHFLDRKCSEWALCTADTIFVDSKATEQFLVKNFKVRKEIKVVSFVISKPSTALRLPLFPKEGVKKILFLGRIHKVKNLHLALELVADLKEHGHDVSFDVYGNDEGELKELEFLTRKRKIQDIVTFKGNISPSKKGDLFQEYHFYMQLSKIEGMAMSVVEAMQNGLVCLVTPVGEIPNYSADEQSAVFVDIHNDEGWRSSIQKIGKVLTDETHFYEISRNCFNNFRDRELFKESLVRTLLAIQTQ